MTQYRSFWNGKLVSELCDLCWCAVADGLLARGKAVIAGREFALSAATQQLQDEQDAKWQSRTVLVRNMPQDVEETLLMYMENKRRGGGDIEAVRTDEQSRTVMVTFREQDGMLQLICTLKLSLFSSIILRQKNIQTLARCLCITHNCANSQNFVFKHVSSWVIPCNSTNSSSMTTSEFDEFLENDRQIS